MLLSSALLRCSLLNIADALFVAAERIASVQDHNRPRYNRVDFFAYMPSGEIFRYHPGRNAQQDARVHRMRFDSQILLKEVAEQTGVGGALRKRPPGFIAISGAPQLGHIAVTPAHLWEVSTYDIQGSHGS